MTRSILLGQQRHLLSNGTSINIYQRDGKYMARGRHDKRQFGVTLGSDVQTAVTALMRLMTELNEGRFVRPSEIRQRSLTRTPIPHLHLRDLCDEFLVRTRQTKGMRTANCYRNRLARLIQFAEQPANQKRWKTAADIDANFALQSREFLMQQTTTRNGHPDAPARPLSPNQVRHSLTTIRMVLNWATKVENQRLPAHFVSPFTTELIGKPVSRDPLKTIHLTLKKRQELLDSMDDWQLLTLSPLLILPLRFEDLTAIQICDINWEDQTLRLGDHLGGILFNKGRTQITLPLPTQIIELFRHLQGARSAGPLFMSRNAYRSHPLIWKNLQKETDVIDYVTSRYLERNLPRTTEQDRKRSAQTICIQELGAVSSDRISKELKSLFHRHDLKHVRPYDVRAAVTTDMSQSGMNFLELRYLTEHSVSDIMNQYTTLAPRPAMESYFNLIEPLLSTLTHKLTEVKMSSQTG